MPVQLPTISIFVSSTWNDLQPERSAVIEALNRLRSMKFVGMEYSGAWDEPPLHPSLKEASECDAYVGIFGGRYGSGITAEEYRKAREKRKRCFIYFKDALIDSLEVDVEAEKQEELRVLKEELLRRHVCESFTTPEDLAKKITADLSNWYAREFLKSWADDVARKRVPGYAPYQLEPRPAHFVGRKNEIEKLRKALALSKETKVATVTGMGGVGKTAFALVVAHELRDEYPHAQLFVDLHNMRHDRLDLVEALTRCLERLGEERRGLPSDLDELKKIYWSNLAGKNVLVVLNDAATELEVRSLMPPSGCALLVTSREKLAVPGTHIELEPLLSLDAQELLTNTASRDLGNVAEEIAILCGHLPIALLSAGSLLQVTTDLPAANYASQLRAEHTRLKTLDRRAERFEIGVEATFNISYERLSLEARRIFRHLSIFPDTFDRMAEEMICIDDSGTCLSDLVRLSLVFFDAATFRYRLHNLVRLYGDQLLLPDERQSGLRRHSLHYLAAAQRIAELHEEEVTSRTAIELFETEWLNLRAGRVWTGEYADGDADIAAACIGYADALKQMLYLRRHPQEQINWMTSAVDASRQLQDRVNEGRYLSHLGTAYSLIDPRLAIDCYEEAIKIANETADRFGLGNACGGLGNAYASLNREGLAIECYKQCLDQLYELSDSRGLGRTLTNLGNIYANRGEHQQSIAFYEQALGISKEIGDRRGQAIALCNLGDEKFNFGKSDAAGEHYQEALLLLNEADDLRGKAIAFIGLGNVHSALDKHTQAFDCYEQALKISREVGNSRAEAAALGSIGNEHASLGCFEKAIEYHEQALDLSRLSSNRDSEIQDLTNLGHVYYLSGDIRGALRLHFQALSLAGEIGSDLYEARAHWNIAQAFHKNNETEAAKTHAAAAFEIFDRLGHPLAEVVHKFGDRNC